jgi:hypothetical protein
MKAVEFLEGFFERHPNILTLARTLVYAVVTAVLIEAGLGDVAEEVVGVAPV